jgi:hypothetical protein
MRYGHTWKLRNVPQKSGLANNNNNTKSNTGEINLSFEELETYLDVASLSAYGLSAAPPGVSVSEEFLDLSNTRQHLMVS